jgi:hypothetical protein
MIKRTLVTLLATLAFCSTTFAAKVVPPSEIKLSAAPNEPEVKAYLDSLAIVVEDQNLKVQAAKRGGDKKAKADPAVIKEVSNKLSEVPPAFLDLMCKTALRWQDDKTAASFSGQVISAIIARKDYAPPQKDIVLKYLPKLPDLIVSVERMNWYDGAQSALVAGWKNAKDDESDGMMGNSASRYAMLASRHGVTDALVSIAKTVKNPDAGKRNKGKSLKEESATLKALVPSDLTDDAALADWVLKNKNKLAFDAQKGVYAVK